DAKRSPRQRCPGYCRVERRAAGSRREAGCQQIGRADGECSCCSGGATAAAGRGATDAPGIIEPSQRCASFAALTALVLDFLYEFTGNEHYNYSEQQFRYELSADGGEHLQSASTASTSAEGDGSGRDGVAGSYGGSAELGDQPRERSVAWHAELGHRGR